MLARRWPIAIAATVAVLVPPGVGQAEVEGVSAKTTAPSSVGRADVDGTSVDPTLIVDTAGSVRRTALAAGGSWLYWGDNDSSIGRANLDGGTIDYGLVTDANQPAGVAVAGGYLFWTNFGGSTIGRSNVDGTDGDESLVAVPGNATSITSDGRYIYYTISQDGSVVRAGLDGSDPQQLLSATGSFSGLTTDGRYLYWLSNFGGSATSIGRAAIDGSGADPGWLEGVAIQKGSSGIAVDSDYIYWTAPDAVGRAAITGTGVDNSFITGADQPVGLAVTDDYIFWTNKSVKLAPKPMVKAVKGRSALSVRVKPRLPGKKQWRFWVQRRADGQWQQTDRYTTSGKKRRRTIDLPRGRYRVEVLPERSLGYAKAYSRAVRLKR